MRAVRTKMTIPPVMEDVADMLAFIDVQKDVRKGPVGTHGYMSGPYALAAAARYPERIGAGCCRGAASGRGAAPNRGLVGRGRPTRAMRY